MKSSVPAVLSTPLLFVALSLAAVNPAYSQSVPPPWQSVDVGSPVLAGSTSVSAGGFAIDAAGADIWAASDQFHFLYQEITGDVDVCARIDGITNAHPWAKAGVMIRSALTASAAHGYALVSAEKGLAFQRRATDDASSAHVPGEYAAAPRWVRLVRQGSRVSAYSSVDGNTWTPIGSSTIALGASAYVGIAVTSHNTSVRTTAQVSNVTITKAGLPDGQANGDIGNPALAGSASFVNGTYTIKAAGRDIWSSADQFHYVYQQLNGDGEVIARVASLANTHSWAKAGVMIRETLSADSRHASAFVTAANGYAFQRRTEPGTWSAHTSGGAGTAPVWLRLVREGALFTAYRSTDGVTWTTIGSDQITMASTVHVGMAVTSHNTTTTTTAVFDNFRVGTSTTPPANDPPIVSLTAPANGATYTAPATIALSASASDPENRLSAVEFYNGNTLLSRVTAAPYSFTWNAVAAGSYTLTAVAHDGDGGSATSAAVSVTVSDAPNQPPTVSLTAPANGATYTAPATIALSASASDPEIRLSAVEFYNGSTLLGRVTAAPYSFTWNAVAAGSYTLTAVAHDSDGASATSAAVSVTVSDAPNQPPTVSLTAPANGATYTAPATIALSASASDPENRLSAVEFYNGNTLLGRVTAAPYSFTWNAVAAGSYTLSAVALDADLGRTTSAAVSVTVNAAPVPTAPRYAVFTASVDHDTAVTSYLLEIFANGADPNSAPPLASSDLGKPVPDATTRDITVDRATFFSDLAAGTYVATVSAIGPGGTSRSTPVTFTR